MEKIFLIGATGFIFLAVYRHRRQKHYTESTNSNKFLFIVFVCGILPYGSSIVIQELVRHCDAITEFFSDHKNLVFGAKLLLSSACAVFWSVLFSCRWANGIWNGLKNKTIVEDDPRIGDGLIDHDFTNFMKNEDIVILTLKNSKVYVGRVLFIDGLDSIAQEQRSIKILPLKSGYRDKDGSVCYNTDYLSAIDFEDGVEEIFSVMQSKIPPLVVLQREVVSYTKYDEKLDTHFFGHSGHQAETEASSLS